jgi:predicted nucleic acid-binding protein
MTSRRPAIVVDTNVFVAAGFRPGSKAGRLLSSVRHDRFRMIWNRATRRETRRILERIPPLAWADVEEFFRPEAEFRGETYPERFDSIPDPDDLKFAALARAAGAILITTDSDLLANPHRLDVLVLTPAEFLAQAMPG